LALFPSRGQSVPRPPSRSIPVIAVGRRVFVNCPGNRWGSVGLVDERGKVLSAVHLADGVEVEVVAWRPRGAGDALYRVRTPSDGADGWLPAANLRRVLVPVPASEPSPTPETPITDAGGRRFGQRSQIGRPPASGSPTPAHPVPAANADRRRFGQQSLIDDPRASGSPAPEQPAPPADARGRRFGQHF